MKVSGERRAITSAESPGDQVQDLFHLFPYHFVTRYLASETRVLDVGFGEGYGAEILSPSVAAYVGLDASEEAVRHAASEYAFANVRFEWSDATAIPFDEESFDLVISFHVLEHIAQADSYLDEMARVCRPGGKLVLVTPNGGFRLDPGERPWNRFHVREFDSVELHRLLARHFAEFVVTGIAGNAAMTTIERVRVARARRFARFDPLGLRYRIPETLLVHVRRLLRARAPRAPSGAEQPGFSLGDVSRVAGDAADAVHLMAVIERQ